MSFDERVRWHESCVDAADSAESKLRGAGARGGGDDGAAAEAPSAEDVIAARDKAAKERAAAEKHAQYGHRLMCLWRYIMSARCTCA